MVKAGSPALTVKEFTTRFVLVPTSVVTPPMIDAYDKGISSFDAGTRVCFDTIPRNAPTTAVLLTKADAAAATAVNLKTAFVEDPFLINTRESLPRIGERSRANDTNNRTTKVARAGLVKPAR